MSAAPSESVLIEILDSHGRVHARERIVLGEGKRSFTVGRAVSADVILDDAHVAALHASVEITPDGHILASDLNTVNGLLVAGKRYRGGPPVAIADGALQIGRTRLRARTTHEQLPPEKPDHLQPASILRDPLWLAVIAAIAGTAQLGYSTWLGAPRDLATALVTALISAVLASSAWIAFWALLSRMLRGEWRWLRHAAIFLGVAAVFYAVNGALELSWFVFSLPQWSARAAWVGALALGCALYLHLINASNIAPRRAAIIACIVPALSGGTGQWVQERLETSNVNHIGASLRIYPPSLRVTAAGTMDDYFKSVTALREAADKRRKTTQADEDDTEPTDED